MTDVSEKPERRTVEGKPRCSYCGHPSPAEEARDAWRPIETAPRDGTAILAWFGQRTGYASRQDVVPVSWCGWGGGVWQNATSGHNMPNMEPTHWMPLPPPPMQKEPGRE
jgi:hypothetical protein